MAVNRACNNYGRLVQKRVIIKKVYAATSLSALIMQKTQEKKTEQIRPSKKLFGEEKIQKHSSYLLNPTYLLRTIYKKGFYN